MEVKKVYLDSILKAYDRPASSKVSSRDGKAQGGDKVTLSPEAGKRLFGEMMEQTLASAVNERSGSKQD